MLLRDVAYGNLYLSEKVDGTEFTEDDEELVRLLAAPGGGRDRERTPVRVGDALVAAARVAERGRVARSSARSTSSRCSA